MAHPKRGAAVTSQAPIDSQSDAAARDARARELRHRIDAMEALDDSTFGRFTGWDWLWCTLGALVLPALALWWFAA
jgi:hypothetical protein